MNVTKSEEIRSPPLLALITFLNVDYLYLLIFVRYNIMDLRGNDQLGPSGGPRYPHLFGNEYHTIAEGNKNKPICWVMKLQDGKDQPKKANDT